MDLRLFAQHSSCGVGQGDPRHPLGMAAVLSPYLVITFLLFAALPGQFDGRAMILLAAGLLVFAFFAWGGGLFLVRAAAELNNLAYLHYRHGDKAGAATLYRAATAADRQTVYAAANLAIVLASLGRCEEAEEAAAEAEVRSRRNGPHARVYG